MNKIALHSILTLTLILQSASLVNAKTKTSKKVVDGITLVQIHHLLGPLKTYVKKNAVKIVFKRQDWYLYSRAPKWDVYLINNKNNSSFKHSFVSWKKSGLHSIELMRSGNQRKKSLGNGKPDEYYGYQTQKYWYGKTTYSCLTGFPHARQIDTILQKTFNTPWAKGAPLFYKVHSAQEKEVTNANRITFLASKQFKNRLETFYLARRIKVDMSPPKPLKQAKTERFVVLGNKRVNSLSNIYDAMNHN